MRVVNGFRCLYQLVKLAPDAWLAMFLRMLIKPEFKQFSFDVVSALAVHSIYKIPDTLWVCLSNILHKLDKKCRNP